MSGSKQVFEAEIRAVDQASGPIKQVMGHFRGLAEIWKSAFGEAEHGSGAVHQLGHELHKTGQEAQKAGEGIAHFAHAHHYETISTHLRLWRGHFGAINLSLGEMARSMGEFMPMLAGLGAAGGLVGLFEITEHAAESVSALNKMSLAAGETVQQFQQLSIAAKMTDVPTERLARGMFHLQANLHDAISGKNKNVAGLFHHLGIAMTDAHGHARQLTDLLPELADAFKKTTDSAALDKMAGALFGMRTGAEMLPLLKEGRPGLDDLLGRAGKAAFAPSEEDVHQLEEYHRSMVLAKEAASGFLTEIGAKLAPVLRPMVDAMTDWVAANRDWISTEIADMVRNFGNAVTAVRLKSLIAGITDVVQETARFLDSFWGATAVLGAFTLAVGSPLIAGVTGAISLLGTLGTVAKATWLIMAANPFLAVAAVMGVAAYEIYQHWDFVKTAIESVWRAIKSAVSAGWDHIRPILEMMKTLLAEATHAVAAVIAPLRAAENFGHSLLGVDPSVAGAESLIAPAARAPSSGGKLHAEIVFRQTPPGTSVRTRTEGNLSSSTDVGYAMPALQAIP